MFSSVRKVIYVILLSAVFHFTANAQISDFFKSIYKGMNSAGYVSQNIPATMQTGETRTVSVTVKNTGFRDWDMDEKYSLVLTNNVADRYSSGTSWGVNTVALPQHVNQGESVTFTFPITAPMVAGRYDFQWAMAKEMEIFDNVGPISYIDVVGENRFGTGVTNSIFLSQYVPTKMFPGERYRVMVTMQNNGTDVWNPKTMLDRLSEYRLVSLYDDWGASPVYLAKTIEPGETAVFEFDVTAPQTPGVYNFQWAMMKGNQHFGQKSDPIQVEVEGRYVNNDLLGNSSDFEDISVPSVMNSNERYTVRISMTNDGRNTWTRGNYKLGMIDPSMKAFGNEWNVQFINLPRDIFPGETVTFTFDITAPDREGLHDFQWQMMHNGVPFGEATPLRQIVIR